MPAAYPYAREPECAHVAARDELGRCILCVFPSLAPPEPEPVGSPLLDAELATDLLRQLRAFKARASLAEFVKQAWSVMKPGTPLEWGPHVEALCWHIQQQLEDRARAAAERGKKNGFRMRAQNVAINIPPRSLKTTVLTCATVWAWVHWPALEILYLSTNPRVARNSARMSRDLIRSAWFQEAFNPPWRIRDDQDALSDMGNTAGGQKRSRGLDAEVTGEGGEWVIIDDPHDARDTPEQIDKAVENYNSAVANRLNDARSSIRTLIMQRLRENDLSGFLLASGEWMHVRLPMEYETKSECRCHTCAAGINVYGWRDWRAEEGEVLHPRFTPEFLASERSPHRLGAAGYAGQMQQRPAPPGGLMFQREWFKKIKRESLPGRKTGGEPQLAVFCDLTTGGETKGSSRNALMVAGRHGVNRYVIDMVVDFGSIIWIEAQLKRLHQQYPTASFVIEAKAAGAPVAARLREVLPALVLWDPGSRSKVARAEAAQPAVHAGNVLLVEAEWNDDFLDEVARFPRGRFDDQPDTLSMMIDYWRVDTKFWDAW